MGTCYYLWRDDTRTAYDMGKAYGWGSAFGGGGDSDAQPMTLSIAEASEVAARLGDVLMIAGYMEPVEVDNHRAYFDAVCVDIARWSGGCPFVFVSEHDRRIENRSMQSHASVADQWITGSRFTTKHPEWPAEWPPLADRREHAPIVGKQGHNVTILGCRCGYRITGNVPRTYYLDQPLGTLDAADEIMWHMAQAKVVNA